LQSFEKIPVFHDPPILA